MLRSSSSPAGGLQATSSSFHASSFQTTSDGFNKTGGSLDLSRVDRDQLPIGVTRAVASRMRLDANGAPALLDLRMNYRNMLNEMSLNGGKIVSHQYALMKPRRNKMWERPEELVPPGTVDQALYYRVKRRKAREKHQQELAERRRAELAAEEERNSAAAAGKAGADEDLAAGFSLDDDEEGALAPATRDPTAALEVQEMLLDEQVKTVHASLQDPANSGFLPQARLRRAMEALGYVAPEQAVVQAAVKSLKRYDPALDGRMRFALDEFCAIVYAVSLKRQEYLREAFKTLDRDGSGTISVREFRHVLWDLGFSVNEGAVEEIITEVDHDKSGQIELPEFEAALRIVHERHGFTKTEASELLDIFDRYDADGSGEMNAIELTSALGWFGTPTKVSQAKEIIKKFDTDVDGRLCRCEFLMVMRSKLEEEMALARALFGKYDTECRGAMSEKQLSSLIRELGYTIPQEVVHESVKELGPATTIMGLVFEDVVKLIITIRARNGFSKSEMSELLDIYQRFDKNGKGELREFELAHALNWLGYPMSHQRRRQLWCDVDVDRNNFIDEGEFLKLVRMLREGETEAARRLLELAQGQGRPREKDVKDMLHRLGYAPPAQFLSETLKKCNLDSTGDGEPDLLGMLSFLRIIRENQVSELRHSAGLNHQMVTKIKGRFYFKLEAGKRIDPTEFERYMYELFKSARSQPSEREKIKQLIRDHCLEGALGLQEMFWVVRLYGDSVEEQKLDKERNESLGLGFTEQQVAQFRQAFVEADADGSGALSEREILMVFDDVGNLNPNQVTMLKTELERMGPGKDNIDFMGFLRLMGMIINSAE